MRCRHEQAEYLEELDGAKVEDLMGKAKVGHAALAPQPKLDMILGGVVLLSAQQREVKIESWLVEEKSLGIGKGTCLGEAEEFNEDKELNVCKMDWCRRESVYEDEVVSDSNRINAVDGGERLLSSTHATSSNCNHTSNTTGS